MKKEPHLQRNIIDSYKYTEGFNWAIVAGVVQVKISLVHIFIHRNLSLSAAKESH